jgi:hypothetical protein
VVYGGNEIGLVSPISYNEREVNNMIKEYQVTLYSNNGYKPVSAIIKLDSVNIKNIGLEAYSKDIKTKGIQKICNKRYWTQRELKQYGYTKVKIREYDKEKIKAENAEKYERIKQERGWI